DATYEGQPAVELSELLAGAAGDRAAPGAADGPRGADGALGADEPLGVGGSAGTGPAYPWRLAGEVIDLLPGVAAAARDRLAGVPAAVIAARWHRAVAEAVVAAAERAARETGVRLVGLSGGVFHNPYLAETVPRMLRARGLEPLLHRQVPPGDGGLALGQAVVALWRAAGGGPASGDGC
ncbi:MAG: carbamoyltransferase HypF, partial [Firmicutes bacterium]|nr:carbamoyltransferase HypF [Bacillota bacterium]